MPRILAGGRRDAKLGTTPSGKAVWLEKLPSAYKGWSASDHLYAAVLHAANRTRGGLVAEAHRALAREGSRGRLHSTMARGTREPITDVVFRVFPEGDVIALFPKEKQGLRTIMSYQHAGQHGDADVALVKELRKASPKEYAPLLAELKRIGYRLRLALPNECRPDTNCWAPDRNAGRLDGRPTPER